MKTRPRRKSADIIAMAVRSSMPGSAFSQPEKISIVEARRRPPLKQKPVPVERR